MKRVQSVLFMLLCCTTFLCAQQFSIQPMVGIGSSQTKDEKKSKDGRLLIGIRAYYNFHNQFSGGLELSHTAGFANSLGGNSRSDSYDPVTNIRTADVSNMKADLILAKLRYYTHKGEKKVKFFTELGAGVITYREKLFDIDGVEEKKIKATNFALQPEVGLSIGPFQFSIQYIYGGKTPEFTYINNGQMIVNYHSLKVSSFFFCGGLKFNF